jgi:hypothetical protein
MRMYLVIAIVLAIATPVLAAEYYIVKDPSTEKCKVSSKKPDGTTRVLVGAETYATKEAGKAAIKTIAECKKKEPSPPDNR